MKLLIGGEVEGGCRKGLEQYVCVWSRGDSYDFTYVYVENPEEEWDAFLVTIDSNFAM